MSNQKKYSIPLEGSLGLLALGADGLRAWRTRKAEVDMDKNSTPEKKQHG